MRRGGAVTLVGLALSLAACGGSARTTAAVTTVTQPVRATVASAPAIPYCSAKDLGIHFVRSDGGAGHLFSIFDFVNVTSVRCRLNGYPGASAFTRTGARIKLEVTRDTVERRRTVILAPHHRVPFTFATTDNVAAGPCQWAAVLRFIPPHDHGYEQIVHRQPICRSGHMAIAQATVAPVGVF
jgi:Protein of unknown function (DUF4232)